MRNTRMPGRRLPTTKSIATKKSANAQSPKPTKPTRSVPISLYRELSADLQATQANITALQSENLQLAEQNQQLRHELQQLAAQTQQLVNRFQQTTTADDEALLLDELGFDAESAATRSQMLDQLYRAMPDYAPAPDASSEDSTAPWTSMMPAIHQLKAKSTQLFTGQAQPPQRLQSTAGESELSGWRLTLVMMLIIFSAFGAGFLIVRPLMSSSSNR